MAFYTNLVSQSVYKPYDTKHLYHLPCWAAIIAIS